MSIHVQITMKRKENTIAQSYFVYHVGNREMISKGSMLMYDCEVEIHPKFIDIVLESYDHYFEKLGQISVTYKQLQEGAALYSTKGDGDGGISWGLETYAKLGFQAVYVARKFSLRTYYILNMIAKAYSWGINFNFPSIGGYGSGPCIELRLISSYMEKFHGKRPQVLAYDAVDWLRVGSYESTDYQSVDLMLTSFVLKDYITVSKLPAHKIHLGLEIKSFTLPGYSIINLSADDYADIFTMFCNRKYIRIHSRRKRPLVCSRICGFRDFFRSNTKDFELAELLSAVGPGDTLVDVGCGKYDVSKFCGADVIRYDPHVEMEGVVKEQPRSHFALYSMSMHHMSDSELNVSLDRVRDKVFIREVNGTLLNRYVDTAKHYMHGDKALDVSYFIPKTLRAFMSTRGFSFRTSYPGDRILHVYQRVKTGDFAQRIRINCDLDKVLTESMIDHILNYYIKRGVHVECFSTLRELSDQFG